MPSDERLLGAITKGASSQDPASIATASQDATSLHAGPVSLHDGPVGPSGDVTADVGSSGRRGGVVHRDAQAVHTTIHRVLHRWWTVHGMSHRLSTEFSTGSARQPPGTSVIGTRETAVSPGHPRDHRGSTISTTAHSTRRGAVTICGSCPAACGDPVDSAAFPVERPGGPGDSHRGALADRRLMTGRRVSPGCGQPAQSIWRYQFSLSQWSAACCAETASSPETC